MAAIKAVKSPEEDPKTGKPRPKSGTKFPYYGLEDAVTVAKTIHEKAGGVCDRAQLATLLGHKGINSGAFLTRVSAAKMFGVIEQTEDFKFRVTQRGLAIVAPVREELAQQAKVQAFLAVELFGKVYNQHLGNTLPPEAGLRNLLETEYQVVPDRVVPTVRIMMDSAEYAGLFKASGNRSKMVMPLTLPGGTAQLVPPAATPRTENPPARGGGGGGDDTGGIDPAIIGLLLGLPPGGTPISSKRRKGLIDAFTSMVGWIYPEADTDE